jgi:hypothetical protein
LGTIFAYLFSGILLERTNNWHTPFYFFGGVALIWFFAFVKSKILAYFTTFHHKIPKNISDIFMLQRPRISSLHLGKGKGVFDSRTGIVAERQKFTRNSVDDDHDLAADDLVGDLPNWS